MTRIFILFLCFVKGVVLQETSQGKQCGLLSSDTSSNPSYLPWHASIYTKNQKPYMQLCGGTLVRDKVVISVAHCFWDRAVRNVHPASDFAVALGKLHRHWDSIDDHAQKSDQLGATALCAYPDPEQEHHTTSAHTRPLLDIGLSNQEGVPIIAKLGRRNVQSQGVAPRIVAYSYDILDGYTAIDPSPGPRSLVGRMHRGQLESIKVPPRFQGDVTNFQEDIALLVLTVPATINFFVKPVCLDFDRSFEGSQLQEGKIGKTAAWGNRDLNKTLRTVDLPYLPIEKCVSEAPFSFREFITADKICVKILNESIICKGDSGIGVSFPQENQTTPGQVQYFFRGVMSVAQQKNQDATCDFQGIGLLTQVTKHEEFVKDILNKY